MNNLMMKATILSLMLGLARGAAAQDATTAPPAQSETPAVETPAVETPAVEAPAVEAPAPKPAPKAAPKREAKAEAPAKLEPKPQPIVETPAPKTEIAAKAEAPKELTPCAKIFVPLADTYKKAYEEMQKWIAGVDEKTAAASARVDKIQEHIQQNEGAITKAKLAGDDNKENALSKDNKQLWSELTSAKKDRSATCSGYAREAIQKAKHFQVDILEKLEACKAQAK